MTSIKMTASSAGLASCHICRKLCNISEVKKYQVAKCPRCGAKVYSRIPGSITRTWALIITALLLYIPANLYPVMVFEKFGRSQGDTIISGVEALINADMWPLALIVFVASIFVPLLKIISIIFILLSVQKNWSWKIRQRTKLLRFVEAIGRWSMLDVFLISIMVALVKLGSVATITAGAGVRAFTAVVVVTILASKSFDPRLIWDKQSNLDVPED